MTTTTAPLKALETINLGRIVAAGVCSVCERLVNDDFGDGPECCCGLPVVPLQIADPSAIASAAMAANRTSMMATR
jgi:hypothetical protein